MDTIERLAKLFTRFPGIGPRQGKRFVYYLLRDSGSTARELAALLEALPSEVSQCKECFRYFTGRQCRYCADHTRSREELLVVATDADLESVERSHVWSGCYFVLGGTVPILDEDPQEKVRIRELKERISKEKPREVVLAFAANMDGDHTVEYLSNMLRESGAKITTLGRGLSTGSELEYADPATIKSALEDRR